MSSTSAKPRWLANYYLRGGIALAAAVIALLLGFEHGIPLLVLVIVWVALWLAARTYAGTDRQP